MLKLKVCGAVVIDEIHAFAGDDRGWLLLDVSLVLAGFQTSRGLGPSSSAISV
jgi:hypothetical protein